jgi:two-component sensor histidine kinase
VKLRGFPERWTIITVSVLMTLALGLLARNLMLNADKAGQLGELVLNRSLDNARWQLGLQMKTYVQNMGIQAEYIAGQDSASADELIERWLPVLSSRYAIKAISITDERGDEQKLERVDSTWRFSSTARSAQPPVTWIQEWPVRQATVPPPVPAAQAADPRKSSWFSEALENRHDEPVWSEGTGKGGTTLFQASLLIRSRNTGNSYRVLHFDLDAGVLVEALAQWAPEVHMTVLTSDGSLLSPVDTTAVGRAWYRVMKEWQALRTTQIVHQVIDGTDWSARILPIELNGTTIYTGALVRENAVSQWTGQGRTAIWTVLVLLLLQAVLLTVVFLQNRGSERQLRKHERRSNIQARHLAKALVERETLDREVHHRVKNNLQVVSSLLNLQAQRVPVEEARNEFMRGKRRIDSMALVHHKLYKQSDLSAVDLHVFLNDLANAVAAMFDPESRTVSHSVDTGGILCEADTTIQLGMIVCELLANCYQHAFPYATGGHIHIAVRNAGNGNFVLTVKDNGKGFDPSKLSPSHLGLEVVEALADQLDGSVHTDFDGGTSIEVTFKPIHQA